MKIIIIGQSAAKPRIEEGSTTIPDGSTQQAIGCGSGTYPIKDKDIVSSIWKHIGRKATGRSVPTIVKDICFVWKSSMR